MRWFKMFLSDVAESFRLGHAYRSAHYNLTDAGYDPVDRPVSGRELANGTVRYSWSSSSGRIRLVVETLDPDSKEWLVVTDVWGPWWPAVVADTEALLSERHAAEEKRRSRAEVLAKR